MRHDFYRSNGTPNGTAATLSTSSSLHAIERDAPAIEAELLDDPAIEACVVLHRHGPGDVFEQVAYVVVGRHDNPSSVRSRLAQQFANRLTAVVPVACIPVTHSGDLDVGALARVPERDHEVETRWASTVAALPGIGRAIAVTGSFLRPAPRIHRDDLCSFEGTRGDRLTQGDGSIKAGERVSTLVAATLPSEDAPPALRCGQALAVRSTDVWTIGEVLCTVPAESRIVYVGSDGIERGETYASQVAEGRILLGGLRRLGLTPSHRIIFQLERAEDVVPLFWACMLGGFEAVIAPLPVSYGEPSRALTQLFELDELFESATIVMSRARVDDFRMGIGRTRLARVRLAVIEDLRDASPDERMHQASPDDVALYALSSGSTGGSKAIALTHRNLLARARGVNAQCYSERDIVLNWLPFDHIGSISEGHVRPLVLGCDLIYASKEYVVSRPLRLLELIDRHHITHTWAPNFSYALVSAALAREAAHAWDLSSVKMLLNAGELITTAAVERFLSDLTPFGLRRSAVQSAFGMAELGSGVTYQQPAEGASLRFHYVDRASLGGAVRFTHPEDPSAIAFASLGTVIPGVSMRIVDSVGNVVTEQVCGRLQFQGQALSPGYYRNAEANRAFGSDGWFDTGDLGFLVDGELVLTGRADTGIVVNGANFSNAEIESVVEEIDGVVTSFVAACAVRARDGGGSKLALYFHSTSADDALLARLLTAIQAQLAKRLGIKADYLLPVAASAIPKTEIGKIQRKKLSEQFDRGEHDALVRRIDRLLDNQNTFAASYFRRSWQPQKVAHIDLPRPGSTLCVVDSGGLDESVARELRKRDLPWLAVSSGDRFAVRDGASLSMRMDEPDDLRALSQWLDRSKTHVHTVIDLRAASVTFAPLGDLVRRLRGHGTSRPAIRLIAVSTGSRGKQRDRLETAQLLAAAKRDVPALRCVLLDTSDRALTAQERAANIVAEITGTSVDETVVYDAGDRRAAVLSPIEMSSASSGALPFGRAKTIVVAGGWQGTGARLVEALLERFASRLVLLDDAGRESEDRHAELMRRWQKAGGVCRRVALEAWDVESVRRALHEEMKGQASAIHGYLHITNDISNDTLERAPTGRASGTERAGRDLAIALERRSLSLACLVEMARADETASFIAASAMEDDIAPNLAIAWQNERTLEPLRNGAREVHTVELVGGFSDRNAVDRFLGGLRLGSDVVAESEGFDALCSGRVVGDVLERLRTKLFVTLRDESSFQRRGDLVFQDRHGNPCPVELVPMREPDHATGIVRHLPVLPLGSDGDVDFERLAELAAGGGRPSEHVPGSAIESEIAEIWKEVLGIEEVDVRDNFFELGGHSLLLVQAHDRLTRAFGPRITLVDLFKYPTVQTLAAFLGEGKPRETAASRGLARAEARNERRGSGDAREVAVIGMACRFPGASDLDTFWANLVGGRESIATLSVDEILAAGVDPAAANHPHYVKASPRLADIELFDADFFGYSAREAELMDPQHRLLLECAWEAFEIAGHNPLLHETPVGVYVGASLNTYLVNNLLPNRGTVDPSDDLSILTLDSMGGFQLMVAADKDYLPTRVSYKLNLTGPSINVQTACSTGLVAIHLACQAIVAGECDEALAGGASVKAPQAAGHLFQEGMIVSPDAHCRAFDQNARGTIFGSGVGIVLLKRLDHALRDRDPIFAVIKGSAVNNDGGVKVGYMAPSGDGQAAVVAEALAVADVSADTVTFVEAHGTGTEIGDPIEIAGLSEAFRRGTDRRGFCAVGSVKTNVGHLQITSGTVGFMKAALALHHRVIPPTLHYEKPNPAIDFAKSPFFVNTAPLAWSSESKRRAGVNSLGIGGTNAHAILEEAPPLPNLAEGSSRPVHLLTLSAKSPEGLAALVERYRQWVDRPSPPDLADVGYTSNVGRSHFDCRLSFCADSLPALQEQLASAPTRGERRPKTRPKILFLFTGQGSQATGMARALFATQPVFRATLERCDALLQGRLEPGLLSTIYPAEGEESRLDRTEWTQPALFAIEYALYEMWRSFGVEPDVVTGHSVGEYVAACVAGVFSLEDGLAMVTERARLMGQQPGPGAMAAVFAPEREVLPRIARFGDALSIAAVNGPTHLVVSGDPKALDAVLAELSAAGISHKKLRVSHAFHSPLMQGAAAPFERFVARFELCAPRVQLISNLTGEVVQREVLEPRYWARHLCEPVRFADGIGAARRAGCEHFIELGPRPALLGIAASLVGDDAVAMLPTLRSDQDDWRTISETMGRLYEAGLSLDWNGFHQGEDRRRVVLPTYPFQRKRHWIDRPASSKMDRALRTSSRDTSLLAKVPLSPLIPHFLWEGELSARAAPFLSDHRVFDRIVVSGACYLALIIEVAARHLGAEMCDLCDVVFTRALAVPEEAQVKVQLVLEPKGADRFAFRLISLAGTTDREAFLDHAEGILVIRADSGKEPTIDLTSLRGRCVVPVAVDEFYAAQRRRKIELGQSYRWFGSLGRGTGEAIGEIVTPSDVTGEFPFHPGLIDACFGLLLACGELNDSATHVPFRVARVRVNGRPKGASLLGHAVRKAATADGVTGSMQLLDGEGHAIFEVEGLEARPVVASAFLPAEGSAPKDVSYELAWQARRSEPIGNTPLAAGSFVVFGGESRTGIELARRLRAAGRRCYLVAAEGQARGEEEPVVALGDSDGIRRLFERVEQPIAGIVHLEGWRSMQLREEPELFDLLAAHERGCRSLLDIVQALRRTGRERVPPLWIVTRGGQAVQRSPIDLGQAPLWGFGRVLSVEQPDLACMRVDLDPEGDEDQSRSLFEELSRGASADEIAWRDGKRHVQRLVRSVPHGTSTVTLDPRAAYMITGAFGALGQRMARWLADKGARHLILVGRHVPEAPLLELQRLVERGGTCRTVAMDVAQPGLVSGLVDQLRNDGLMLKGVLHLAGILDDGVLTQQSWERFRRVMDGKVNGAIQLHSATRALELDFFVCFSSIASVFGSPAQGNYAAANAFLDALCHFRRREGRPGLSINWGPWGGEGMVASVQARDRERIAAQGLLSLEPDHAVAALEAVWGDAGAQRTLALVDWFSFGRAAHGGTVLPLYETLAPRRTQPPRRSHLREELESTPMGLRRRLLQKLVRTEVTHVLGSGARTFEDRQGLAEMGLDSLQAIDVKNRLGMGLGITLPSTLLFDHPSVQSLADYLAGKMTDIFDIAPAHSPAQTVAAPELGDLSEHQLFDLLAEQLDNPHAAKRGENERR